MAFNEKLNQLIDESAKWSKEDRVSICKGAVHKIFETLSVNGEQEVNNFLMLLLRVGVSGDKTLSVEEYELFVLVTGSVPDPDEFYDMTNGGSDPALVKAIDEEIDHFTDDAKFACCTFVLCFFSADEVITDNERAVITKLFE